MNAAMGIFGITIMCNFILPFIMFGNKRIPENIQKLSISITLFGYVACMLAVFF